MWRRAISIFTFAIGLAALTACGYKEADAGGYTGSTTGNKYSGGGAASVSVPVVLTNTSGYAITVNTSGADTDNRAYQCSSTWSGASGVGYCFHGLMAANSAVTAYAEKLGCTNSGGGGCRALELSDGDFFANTQSGVTQINGSTTFAGAQVNIGKGGSNNSKLYEKHNTSPSLGGNCTSGTGSAITGSDWLMGVTVGTTSTACTITFTSSPANFTSPPDCMVVAMTGTNQAGIVVGTITTTSLPITGLANSAKYVIQCVGH